MLDWWVVNEKAIEPHVPVWEKAGRTDGTFSRSGFDFDEQADRCTCPNGGHLVRYQRCFPQPRSGISKDNTIRYYADGRSCAACALKKQYCPNYAAAQSAPKRARIRACCWMGDNKDVSISAQFATTQTDGNTVCPYETDPQGR